MKDTLCERIPLKELTFILYLLEINETLEPLCTLHLQEIDIRLSNFCLLDANWKAREVLGIRPGNTM